MTIEKTYKLSIKDTAYFLTEEEVTKLYEQCRKALNIDNATPYFPNYPPGVRKFDDDKTKPLNPTTPSIPYPYDTYPWYTPTYPSGPNYPYWTSPNTTVPTRNPPANKPNIKFSTLTSLVILYQTLFDYEIRLASRMVQTRL